MYKQILAMYIPEFEKALEFFKKEAAKMKTGYASPALVQDIFVESFDTFLPLKQLASISCPERRQILIEPWDPSSLAAIEKALQKSPLGVSPIVEKTSLRVTLPPLTQEFRNNLVKLLGEQVEETRKTMRKLREEAWNAIQQEAREGKIREDDKFRGKEELQKLVDDYHKKLDELAQRKRQEIQEG